MSHEERAAVLEDENNALRRLAIELAEELIGLCGSPEHGRQVAELTEAGLQNGEKK